MKVQRFRRTYKCKWIGWDDSYTKTTTTKDLKNQWENEIGSSRIRYARTPLIDPEKLETQWPRTFNELYVQKSFTTYLLTYSKEIRCKLLIKPLTTPYHLYNSSFEKICLMYRLFPSDVTITFLIDWVYHITNGGVLLSSSYPFVQCH